MNDMSPAPSTALAIPAATELAVLFQQENGLDPIVARIAEEVRAHTPDLSTAKGRDAIKSLAYKVSRSKTALDEAGKKLNEDARAQISVVDAARKRIRDQLDALRDEARAPLDAWEAAEVERKAKIEHALNHLRTHGCTVETGSTAIAMKITDLTSFQIDADYFGDQCEQAEMLRETSVRELRTLLAAAEKAEADARELEELRAERAKRAAVEAERLKQEAEDQARREAEAKAEAEKKAADDRARMEAEEAARLKAAAEKAAAAELATRAANARAYIEGLGKDIEKPFPVLIHLLETEIVGRVDALGEHAEAVHQLRLITLESVRSRAQIAERARKDAEDQAKREADEVARKEAEQAAVAAAQRERERIEAELRVEADARAKREADQAHRQRIRDDIATSMNGFVGELEACLIADAIMEGAIPHVFARL